MKDSLPGLLFAAVLAAPLAVHADTAKPTPWEKFGENDGIAVFRRDLPGTPVVALRGEGIVDAPILKVATVLVDTSRATEWIDSVVEARTLRKVSDSEYVEWDHVATPFVLKDRDFVFNAKLELRPKDKKVILNYHSVDDPAAPTTSYIRGRFVYGTFALTAIEGGRKTRVLAELLCDPKGSVAKWIVNMFQKSWPHDTLMALRAQVRKPDIKDNPKLKEALISAGF